MTESTIRRALKKAGYDLHKSRAGFSVDNLCGYMIVDSSTHIIEAGGRFDLSLEDVERFLKED